MRYLRVMYSTGWLDKEHYGRVLFIRSNVYGGFK